MLAERLTLPAIFAWLWAATSPGFPSSHLTSCQSNLRTRTHRPTGLCPAQPPQVDSVRLAFCGLNQRWKPTAQLEGPCAPLGGAGRVGTSLRSQEAGPGAAKRLALRTCQLGANGAPGLQQAAVWKGMVTKRLLLLSTVGWRLQA